MQYMLVIYADPDHYETIDAEAKQLVYKDYVSIFDDLTADGRLVHTSPLENASEGKTVAVRSGRRNVVDGPFAATKEQIAGYFLVEANDLDEACAIAARIPDATHGGIEVRPILNH